MRGVVAIQPHQILAALPSALWQCFSWCQHHVARPFSAKYPAILSGCSIIWAVNRMKKTKKRLH
jgi:hypothetical protein